MTSLRSDGRDVAREAGVSSPVVVITDSNFESDDLEREELGAGIVLRREAAQTEADVIACAADADGLLVQWAPITEKVLDSLPRLRAIVRYGIGLDNIDLEAAASRNVAVCNVSDYCIDEVATHATTFILAAHRRLFEYRDGAKGGKWETTVAPVPVGAHDDAVGIVGLGRTGRAVATKLRGLGFPVSAWDPFAPADAFDGIVRSDSLVELAAGVNHLTIHTPATDQTRGLIGDAVLEALGSTGHLVNTARGAIVDEEALLRALKDGTLGRASLDVLISEPPTALSRAIADHPRVVVTPHVAYLSRASEPRLRRNAASSLKRELDRIARDVDGQKATA